MKKIAIITGATGGIGNEFVRQILQYELDEVWAIGRNEMKLKELCNTYGEKIVSVTADLSEISGIEKIEKMLSEQRPEVRFLINNAGLAKMASYKEYTREEIIRMIDMNCKAPVLLCNVCIPYMKTGSNILNVSSASAFQPNPYINLYAASKAFERSYSRALNVELMGTGITVTAVCPGWVDTELLPKELNGKTVKFPGIVTAERVVRTALRDAEKKRDMSVCSLYVKCQHMNVKFMPQRLVMKIWTSAIRKYIRE
ncbi:MAG: SDR family NAD(P)-dependent oxidoreductase [Lachnospiraceae bacterium]|nr:SDR family NAD(P)-dependent oxidoreductase [Lachnospiraceae bacterium]